MRSDPSCRRLALIVVLVASACQDDVAELPSDDEAGEQDEGVELVELDGELNLVATCTELAPDEVVASVSPEGYAWLASESGGSALFRVVSPGGNLGVVELDLEAEHLQAWGDDRATYTADGIMWQTEGMLTEPLYWSAELPSPSRFCGDPTIDGDGFVIAGAELYQRDAGLWWRWLTPAGQDYGPISHLGVSYGACTDRYGALWLANVAGETWRLSSSAASLIPELAGTSALTIDASFGAAGIIDEQLIYGEPDAWTQVVLPSADQPSEPNPEQSPPVLAIAASPERLWVSTAERLYAREPDGWLEVRVDGQAVPAGDRMWADAGGVWIASDDQLCRLASELRLEIDGLRPLQRTTEPSLSFSVLGPGVGAVDSLEILLDGETLAQYANDPLPWTIEAAELGDAGWHTIDVVTTDSALDRRLEVELRVAKIGTWFEDINPLAEIHCTGINGCHGPEVAGETRPVLSDYEGWVLNADAIRARVGLSGDMPPPSSRLESWDAEEVSQILTWIEAGLPQGQESP